MAAVVKSPQKTWGRNASSANPTIVNVSRVRTRFNAESLHRNSSCYKYAVLFMPYYSLSLSFCLLFVAMFVFILLAFSEKYILAATSLISPSNMDEIPRDYTHHPNGYAKCQRKRIPFHKQLKANKVLTVMGAIGTPKEAGRGGPLAAPEWKAAVRSGKRLTFVSRRTAS